VNLFMNKLAHGDDLRQPAEDQRQRSWECCGGIPLAHVLAASASRRRRGSGGEQWDQLLAHRAWRSGLLDAEAGKSRTKRWWRSRTARMLRCAPTFTQCLTKSDCSGGASLVWSRTLDACAASAVVIGLSSALINTLPTRARACNPLWVVDSCAVSQPGGSRQLLTVQVLPRTRTILSYRSENCAPITSSSHAQVDLMEFRGDRKPARVSLQ
jgi:hypothetical protein